jgi:hypothetical protein
MYMASALGGKEHFNPDHEKHGDHGDEAGHRVVTLVPEGREAWVGEGDKSGGQEVHEGGRDEDAGAKVPRQEEELVRDGDFGEAFGDNGKRTSCVQLVLVGNTITKAPHTGRAESEYQDKSKDMQWCVIGPLSALGAACGSLVVLPASKLVVEQLGRDVAP